MEFTFRWFGPKDPTSLSFIKQTGAKEVVTSLADAKYGESWSISNIQKRQKLIQENKTTNMKLIWSVAESLPVHNVIKLRTGKYKYYTQQYLDSLNNLAKCNIKTICYNFMPVIDWVRTDLLYKTDEGSIALKYDHRDMCIFENFILELPGAYDRYSSQIIDQSKKKFKRMNQKQIQTLMYALMGGLAANDRKYNLSRLRYEISQYNELSHKDLQNNLKEFLNDIFPVIKEKKIYFCIHPDDPPYSIYGLPRIVSNRKDIKYIINLHKDNFVGLTLCSGSLGVKKENNITKIINDYGEYINFIHLRNIIRDKSLPNFLESDHLEGDLNMVNIIKAILKEEKRRKKYEINNSQIPMRPDHGHTILYDQNNKTIPGYSVLGRMKGLAQLKGIIKGLEN